ncbi:Dimeric alpha-beta barrel [Phytophthora cactorum]|nr:Dimeric alpha-beta barrel [Phytophthora cactorum]
MSTGRVKVLCERIMSRGYEPRVARLMENVKATVRAQPGFISIDTYAQVDDHTKYVVFSELPEEVAVLASTNLSCCVLLVGVQEGLRHVAGQQGVPEMHSAD